jgi:hypothetical protein
MGSGEADGVKYMSTTGYIPPSYTPYTPTPKTDTTNSVNWYYSSSEPKVIYMYQLECPSCETLTWGQLDSIVKCANGSCEVTLRAVSKLADYEVEITT